MKKILTLLAIIFVLLNSRLAFANDIPHLNPCIPDTDICADKKDGCLPTLLPNGELFLDEKNNPAYICRVPTVKDTFGKIQAPAPLAKLLEKDKTGAGAISTLLSNTVNLIFSIAAVVLLFMVLWGAFDWMISEGEKEKVAAARSKILNAMIGLILIAIAFAIVRLLSQFTGFTFFKGQNPPYYCYQGFTLKFTKDPPVCVNNLDLSERPAIKCNENQVFDTTKGECKNR